MKSIWESDGPLKIVCEFTGDVSDVDRIASKEIEGKIFESMLEAAYEIVDFEFKPIEDDRQYGDTDYRDENYVQNTEEEDEMAYRVSRRKDLLARKAAEKRVRSFRGMTCRIVDVKNCLCNLDLEPGVVDGVR